MTNSEADWKLIEGQLPQGWRELAEEMRLIRKLPAHMGQKVMDVSIALRLVLHYVAERGSMRRTVAVAAAASLVDISQVGFFKWMAKIGCYLETLIGRMVDAGSYAAARWGGYVLIAADATCVERPGAKGTTARLHYALHLSDLRPRAIRVTDESIGETMRHFDTRPGELWIVDRGYSNPPNVEVVVDRGADILVRLNRHSMPLWTAGGERIDVLQLLGHEPVRGRAHERKLYVCAHSERRFAVRLCWMRLPQPDAAKARARAKRQGVRDRAELGAAEYIVVLTTADRERISAEQVIELYRARWQIELDFKRDKSIGQLDMLPSLIPKTIHAWLCAKVLLDIIVRRLAAQSVRVPPCAFIDPQLANRSASARIGSRRRALVRDAVGLVAGARRATADSAA